MIIKLYFNHDNSLNSFRMLLNMALLMYFVLADELLLLFIIAAAEQEWICYCWLAVSI